VSVSPLVEMDSLRFFSGSQSVVHVVCFVWAMRGPISQRKPLAVDPMLSGLSWTMAHSAV